MTRSRDAAFQALFNLAAGAYAWKNSPSRTNKVVLWDGSANSERPALYQFEGGDDPYIWTQSAAPTRELTCRWVIYLDATGVQQSPTINAILDALDAAMASNAVMGKQTLGGLCDWARIVGPAQKEPGDLDGDGILMIPVKITLP